ncbi:MAG TPA: glycosyltransferase family 4 protein [Kofleriaceae bacterium]|nr:glycosyltransferase family 4 protein [Kofleriaceae bacterium]
MDGARLRVLIITKIFPNALEPLSSPFNRQQFAALGRLCDVEVLASIPWFPGAGAFGKWSPAGRLTGVPRTDTIDGLAVKHPRFLFVPRYGVGLSGLLYAASLLPHVAAYRGRVDVVLGSWAYPDGAAAVALAALLGVPSVVKLHGSDINVVAKMPGPRRQLRLLLPRAGRVVAVSRALADEVVALGVPKERVAVVANGVDPELFHPRERAASRQALGRPADGKLIVYVGRLERQKGVLDLLDAFAELAPRRPDLRLALIGDGAARGDCEAAAGRIGAQVHIAGARPLAEVPLWMGASDLVTLPSWNEGTPNVLLEALACGRPAVATRVGGIPDVIDAPELGRLVPAKDPNALAEALERVAYGTYDGGRIALAGARGGWADSAARLLGVLTDATENRMTP